MASVETAGQGGRVFGIGICGLGFSAWAAVCGAFHSAPTWIEAAWFSFCVGWVVAAAWQFQEQEAAQAKVSDMLRRMLAMQIAASARVHADACDEMESVLSQAVAVGLTTREEADAQLAQARTGV